MKTTKEYYWICSGNLVMECVLDKRQDGHIFLRTPNGAILCEPYTLGLNAFLTKKSAIQNRLDNVQIEIARCKIQTVKLELIEKYLLAFEG